MDYPQIKHTDVDEKNDENVLAKEDKGEKLNKDRLGSMWINYILLQRSMFYRIPSSTHTMVGPPTLPSAEQKAILK